MVKKLVLTLVVIFVVAYVSFGIWIAKDTKAILVKAMSGDSDYTEYMNNVAYQKINPIKRGMTDESFQYNENEHKIGFVLPIHFFFISKAFVTQQYSNDNLAFREPVRLSLKLKSGKWYATDAHIKP
ncbi:hypothetical protein [Paenibacillus sp. Y412MC10]|uniref:hypothetical protein n=1 Tax=Geobacillus sp. (strain Y412MC10) TaxID=481743 RepID=UPI0011AB5C2D|nr:hypothetical protein [Paenibacillus sp. Y412MC10]